MEERSKKKRLQIPCHPTTRNCLFQPLYLHLVPLLHIFLSFCFKEKYYCAWLKELNRTQVRTMERKPLSTQTPSSPCQSDLDTRLGKTHPALHQFPDLLWKSAATCVNYFWGVPTPGPGPRLLLNSVVLGIFRFRSGSPVSGFLAARRRKLSSAN